VGAAHWIDGERAWDKVVALGEDVIYVGNPSRAKAGEMKQRLESGEAATMVLKDDVTLIPLNAIVKVSYNRHHDSIDIDYKPGKEKEDKTLYFSDQAERDDFAGQLAERLSGFESEVVEYSQVRAAVSPLGFGSLAVFFTWLLHMAAGQIAAGAEREFSGRNAGIKRMLFWALDLIGPTGVLIVGGLVLALTCWSLVDRVKTPPIMHILKRPKG